MDVTVAVLRDLYLFVFRYRFGWREAELMVTDSVPKAASVLPPRVAESEQLDLAPSLSHTASLPLSSTSSRITNQSRGYVKSLSAPIYSLPTKTFDGVILVLTYGEAFIIQNRQGNWLQIVTGEISGWIAADDTTDSLAALEPKFAAGTQYAATSQVTEALRTLIQDSFYARELGSTLQNVEYVSYKLQQKNRSILWPKTRPRIAGTWQRILRGERGIHLGVSPKTESVMEYTLEDATGHVAFVESVFPDGSITISEVGYPSEGVFSERTLSRDEWKELRPVFIEVA